MSTVQKVVEVHVKVCGYQWVNLVSHDFGALLIEADSDSARDHERARADEEDAMPSYCCHARAF